MNKYKKVLEYLREHIEDYNEKEINYIINNIDILEHNNFVPDTIRQIYDETGLLDDENNIYLGFIKLIEENFNINTNIIEVGGGVIPSLAKHLCLKQKKGTVTVYDPRLTNSMSSSSKLILKKEKFTEKTNISESSLLIGFMPCEATEILIKKATKNKKNFIVALCEGGHNEYNEYYDEDIWTNNMKYLVSRGIKSNGLGKYMETDLSRYSDPYPVIYNKRMILK